MTSCELARGLLDLDANKLRGEAQVVGAAVVRRKVRGDAFAEIDALADIEWHRVEPVESIDARRFRYRLQRPGGKLRRQARRPQNSADHGIDFVLGPITIERLHERPQNPCIAERAMAIT